MLGIYGVYQFLTPAGWDCLWLENVIANGTGVSFGLPDSLLVRVFSTLNSPGPFANMMMVGVLFLFVTRSPLKPVAAIAGYTSFLLSMVRTAWLSWIVGLVWILKSSRPQVMIRVVLSIALLVAGTACDVVPGLISRNQAQFRDAKVDFRCLDITRDDLPHAGVALLRQVLQHLSNAQIMKVVPKLHRYRFLLLSEHLPAHPNFPPNLEKPTGALVRLFLHSGPPVRYDEENACLRPGSSPPARSTGHSGSCGIFRVSRRYSAGDCRTGPSGTRLHDGRTLRTSHH